MSGPLKNARHERFAQELAKGKSACDAYTAAGYKESRSAASRLSTNVNIARRVKDLVESGANKAEIDIARVLKELARLGTSDIRKLFDESGSLLAITDLDDETAAAVASVEVVTRTLPGESDDELDPQPHGGALARRRNAKVEYVHKLKFWDKNSALEKIAKHLGMFIDRHEHTGRNGGPIQTEDRTTASLIEEAKRLGIDPQTLGL
ncbi:terminase small subunit [Croceibacterium aestuarii]|uniref:terminase small subunit n=1 Tax=Croceibacterium aestuarii TaxID=3064139 RepID=UPI00272EAF1E|nr:terminase small subunit [Croceibacterium sp. D39]